MNKAKTASDGKIRRGVPRYRRVDINRAQIRPNSGKSSKTIFFIAGGQAEGRIGAHSENNLSTRNVIVGENIGKNVVIMDISGLSSAIFHEAIGVDVIDTPHDLVAIDLDQRRRVNVDRRGILDPG